MMLSATTRCWCWRQIHSDIMPKQITEIRACGPRSAQMMGPIFGSLVTKILGMGWLWLILSNYGILWLIILIRSCQKHSKPPISHELEDLKQKTHSRMKWWFILLIQSYSAKGQHGRHACLDWLRFAKQASMLISHGPMEPHIPG